MTMMRRVVIKIYGKAQGVFFRSFAREAALDLGLVGFVRNEPDGSVYIIAEGAVDKLLEFIEWCRKGPPAAEVSGIETKWQNANGEYKNFSCL